MNEDPVWLSSFRSKKHKMGVGRSGVDPSPNGGGGGGGILAKWGGGGIYPDVGVNPRGYGILYCEYS